MSDTPRKRLTEAEARAVLREYPDADLSAFDVDGDVEAMAADEATKTLEDLAQLERELAELEATDPEVAKAAANLERVKREIIDGKHCDHCGHGDPACTAHNCCRAFFGAAPSTPLFAHSKTYVAIRFYVEQRPSGFWVLIRVESNSEQLSGIERDDGPYALQEEADARATHLQEMAAEIARDVGASKVITASGTAGES